MSDNERLTRAETMLSNTTIIAAAGAAEIALLKARVAELERLLQFQDGDPVFVREHRQRVMGTPEARPLGPAGHS